MDRTELIEWIIIIGCIVIWWPDILIRGGYVAWGYPMWYHLLTHYGVPAVLIGIFVRRYRRMQAGLEYSKDVVDSQRGTPGAGPKA
ncbi:MAG: hypothetical protein ABFE08_15000 [Armatimonadia bacterium]